MTFMADDGLFLHSYGRIWVLMLGVQVHLMTGVQGFYLFPMGTEHVQLAIWGKVGWELFGLGRTRLELVRTACSRFLFIDHYSSFAASSVIFGHISYRRRGFVRGDAMTLSSCLPRHIINA